MRPIKFKGWNKTLIGKGRIKPLPVYTDGEICLSCWTMNLKERIRAFVFGKIWLQMRSGKTQPPVMLVCGGKKVPN